MNLRGILRTNVIFASVLWLLSSFYIFTVSAQGILPGETSQTNPKDRPTEITATVPPQGAPPTPILIEPTNNKILRSGVVLFQWYEVEHLSAIDRYELYLNGDLAYGPIHTTNQETDDYILTYDAENGIYSLRLQQDAWLPDGVYTWKIRVIDVNERGTDSTTWTFTVDSTPPPIVVTEIDDQPYAISATDPSTFPSEPIEVSDQSPLISGTSEAGSKLEVVVRYEDGTIWQTYTTTVFQSGAFDIQFGKIPADTVLHLTFTAIDPASNSTVLDAIDIVYRPREIVIPLPDIFPTVLTIRVRIPGKIFDFPDIEPPSFPDLPPPFTPEEKVIDGKPVPPTEQVFTRPVQPYGLFLLLGLLSIGWYVIALFMLTGNSWKWFGVYLREIFALWFFQVRSKGVYSGMDVQTGVSVPFMAHTLRSLSESKKLKNVQVITSLVGSGVKELPNETLIHVQSYSDRFVYTLTGSLDKKTEELIYQRSKEVSGVVLTGEDFMVSSRAKSVRQVDEHSMLIPIEKTLVILLHPVQGKLVQTWMTWLPQIGLICGLISSLWLAYLMPEWWSFALLIVIGWIGLRDVMVQMQKKMSVYAKQ